MKKIVTTRNDLRQLIESAVGLTFPEGPKEKDPAVINEPAPDDNVPIVPLDSQLDRAMTVEIPIDDEEYEPENVIELSHAVAVLAKKVPPERIIEFFKNVRRLTDRTIEAQEKKEKGPEVGPKDNKEIDVDKIQEMNVRRAVRKILAEAGFDGEGGYEGSRGTKKKGARELSLDDVAREAGLQGASGARQLINKAAQKIKFLLDMPEDERNEIIIRAAGEYIDYLVDLDKKARRDPATAGEEGLSEEDAEFMRDHPEYIQELDGFREFLRKYWLRAMRDAGADEEAPDVASIKLPTTGVEDDDEDVPRKPKMSKADREARAAKKADAVASRKLGGLR